MQTRFFSAKLLVGLFIWAILLSILFVLLGVQNGRRVSLGTQSFEGPMPAVKRNISTGSAFPIGSPVGSTTGYDAPCPSGFVMLYEGGIETGCSLVTK